VSADSVVGVASACAVAVVVGGVVTATVVVIVVGVVVDVATLATA
jgi:hypothetical protein